MTTSSAPSSSVGLESNTPQTTQPHYPESDGEPIQTETEARQAADAEVARLRTELKRLKGK